MRRIALWLSILVAALCAAPPLHADEQVFFGNLHSHTSYSDGSGTPDQAYKYARDTAKLDFLAITDHNHRGAEAGAKERADGIMIATTPQIYAGPQSSATIPTAGRYTKTNKFIALYGQEYSTISKGNHVNVFDIGEVIDDRIVTNGGFNLLLSWLETHPDTTGQKAIIQFNHANQLDDYRIEYGLDDSNQSTNGVNLDISSLLKKTDVTFFYPWTTTFIELMMNREPTPKKENPSQNNVFWFLPQPAGVKP